MAKKQYSIELVKELRERIKSANLLLPFRPSRYEKGDALDLSFTTVWPEESGHGRFTVEKFAGGGFAGQVYQCRLASLDDSETMAEHGLTEGGVYAVKIMIPPNRFSKVFRDVIYWLGFQAPFSAQVCESACKSGLLWQKLVRRASGVALGSEDAVGDMYASFYDSNLKAYGQVGEWIEGRTWLLEADIRPRLRRGWRDVDPSETDSPEFVAKRQFMHRFVKLLHKMGARELARQYEWWTLKSQPNVLKRIDSGDDPSAGLCAVDFRAGLALLPFLPMSPGDIALIFAGLREGSLVQFDRPDFGELRRFITAHGDDSGELAGMMVKLESYDGEYRRSMPDITHQGFKLLADKSLRHEVRCGLAKGFVASGNASEEFASRITEHPFRFFCYQLLGILPLLGRFLRRLWGNGLYRQHVKKLFVDDDYFARACRAGVRVRLIKWLRSGRAGEERVRYLSEYPWMFWLQRLTLGFIFAFLHHWIAEPSYVRIKLARKWDFMRRFFKEAEFREKWLTDQVHEGHAEGVLNDEERDRIMASIRDPFIVKYLKCVAFHFATLPVTQIFSLCIAAAVAGWIVVSGGTKKAAAITFVAILGVFQIMPVSPGSLCRGVFTTILVVRERDFKDYMVALPLSFLKYIGYLAFPIQMVAAYPELARFMASRWATGTVHIVPVFGEKGALLEHAIFDLFFNRARMVSAWAGQYARWLLTGWMLFGAVVWSILFAVCAANWGAKMWVNSVLMLVTLFVLPRVLFYPIIKRTRIGRSQEPVSSGDEGEQGPEHS
jgi:hypothetical protein